ncbi:hypothetical protein C0971_01310 [Bacillus methanolicus]|uniref:DUF4937 domain-containing protein n=1 Tax=Bacillus methanolicus TaxID=1471 RepID=UPI00200CE1D9|nr:DUF4937 domain-containing protein [Bacillus methanolicus]UQD50839.1 hypothetical protein C0971_01310 [Bacillus methanolicus]
MLIKFIQCSVFSDRKEAFHRGQLAWLTLHEAPGFVCQFGGWGVGNAFTAKIFAIWQTRQAYENFMKHIHDEIFLVSGQKGTYKNIDVKIFELEINLTEISSVLNSNNKPVFFAVNGNSLYLKTEPCINSEAFTIEKSWSIFGDNFSRLI